MSTNIQESNKKLFDPIISEIIQDISSEVHQNHSISFSPTQREFYKKLSLKNQNTGSIIHGKKYAFVQHKQDNNIRKFLTIINIDIEKEAIFNAQFLSVADNSFRPPLFLLLASEGIIEYKKKDLADFYENELFLRAYPSNVLQENELENIENYFDSFIIFELTEASNFFNADTYQILLYIISDTTNLKWLPYNSDIIVKYTQVASIGNTMIPYEYVLSAFTAVQWKHAFKDLYRCLEMLFPIGKISALSEVLTCLQTENPFDIAMALEDKLKWRSDEESALISLLEKADISHIQKICDLLLSFESDTIPWAESEKNYKIKTDNLAEKTLPKGNEKEILKEQNEIKQLEQKILKLKRNFAGAKIYGLRNSFVHSRDYLTKKAQVYQFNSEQWNKLIESMLDIIINIYDNTKFHNEVSQK